MFETVAAEHGIGSEELTLIRSEHGKPYFESPPFPLFFSLAHSGRELVLALGDCEVGVDIEPLDRVVPQRVADRYLGGDRNIAAWTRYEARGKLLGCGIPIPRELADTPVQFSEHDIVSGYVVTVAKKYKI